MSIRTAKEVVCDKCHWSERMDGTMAEEWPSLRQCGWKREKGRHYCPKCVATHPFGFVSRPKP